MKTIVEKIDDLRDNACQLVCENRVLREDYDDLDHKYKQLLAIKGVKVSHLCNALFTNDLGNAPGKLIIVDYWGNEIGEWTPETLREFMESRLL